ncbi:MAG: methyltransferase domain-containing protein [Candidatus Binataceae bacterium]|nr:methyltransferase domain-containing protein [Candidatus Binataceae bacterium]
MDTVESRAADEKAESARAAAARPALDHWFIEHLVCPADHGALEYDYTASELCCARQHRYAVADGIPVMLIAGARPTNTTAIAETRAALVRLTGAEAAPSARQPGAGAANDQNGAIDDNYGAAGAIDQYVQRAIGATNGNFYARLRGRLERYPIPHLELPPGAGRRLLDSGSNWGRWTVAAARLGYEAIGIDPSFTAIAAARNVARDLGAKSRYLVADARWLPFRPAFFDVVFSYSVFQHFAPADCAAAVAEMGRVAAPGGLCKVQMLQPWGLRALYHQMRRGWRRARDFEVRYWPIGRLRALFAAAIGPAEVTVEGFFSANARPEDRAFLARRYRVVVGASERLKRASRRCAPLKYCADSVWVTARRETGRVAGAK